MDCRTASSFNRDTAGQNHNACDLTAAGDSGGYKGHARTFTKEARKRDAGGRAAHKRIYRRTALRRCRQSRTHPRREGSLLDGHAGQPTESCTKTGSGIATHVLRVECQGKSTPGYLLPHGDAVFLRLLCSEVSWL